jgi:hypothetical protein
LSWPGQSTGYLLQRELLTVQDGFPFTTDEDEHLIHIGVRLLADLAARRETHQHYLAMQTGDDLLTEVRVLLRKASISLLNCIVLLFPF